MVRTTFLNVCAIALLVYTSVSAQKAQNEQPWLPVAKEGKWGFIDRTGKLVIDFQFLQARKFSDGLASVFTQSGYAYINSVGKAVIGPFSNFFGAGDFSEGLAPVGSGTKYGYIDKTGQLTIKPQFEQAYGFVGGVARVKDDGKYGYINSNGDMITDLMFDEASDFSDGVATVKLGSRVGYIDKGGRYIWKPSR